MGLLQNGQWISFDSSNNAKKEQYRRQDNRFRSWITADGSAGPTGEAGFKAEPGRYHLYVSAACPWAHRTLIFRQLLQLEDYIDVTVVDPIMLDNGWQLNDPLYHYEFLYQLYLKADASYEGRVSVPVLWDKHKKTIVSNESADIIRMFNNGFSHLNAKPINYYPKALQSEIDQMNDGIFAKINIGVYRAGFATEQKVYESAVNELFTALDELELLLAQQRYLVGEQLTEADWRLFTTLIRFDAVYFSHFKCNRKRLADYPVLSAYLRDLYQVADIAKTVDFDQIKTHYYKSHQGINPTGIIPLGPDTDFSRAHGRESISMKLCANL